jgi:formylmethanofuran dehydrogenase subunit B
MRSIRPACLCERTAGSTLIVVDVCRTRTADVADLFLQVVRDQDYEVLGVLRARLKNRTLAVKKVGGRTLSEWEALLERMKSCRYGIVFYGTGLTMSRGGVESVAQLMRLVNDLNAHTRFSVMAMRGPLGFGNVGGSFKVLCWQTGYPFAINFARGYPRYNPGEFTASELLERQEVDAVLVVGANPVEYLPPRLAAMLERLPSVVLGPRLNRTARQATVYFPTATYGISAPGTMFGWTGSRYGRDKCWSHQFPLTRRFSDKSSQGSSLFIAGPSRSADPRAIP